MGLVGDFGGTAHRGDFVGMLEQPHLMDNVARIEYPAGAVAELRLSLIGSAQHRQHALVHFVIDPERKEYALVALQIFGQHAIELGQHISLVSAVIEHRAFDAGAAAGPDLAFLVARANEQYELTVLVAGRDHRHRFGLGKAGQVVEITVLAVDELDIVGADGDRRAGQHRVRARCQSARSGAGAAG